MDRFVIGTGRCGSTLLSAMLHEDPTLLSISEFFVGLIRELRFEKSSATPAAFAQMLGTKKTESLNFTMRRLNVPEIVYPYESSRGRHGYDDPIAWPLAITLPRLSDDPDALLDEMLAFCAQLPEQSLADQYRAVFRWLAERRGASDWIERSGSSFEYLDELIAHFPEGRYLHLHRDGREAALSMREHYAFRYRVALLYEIPDQDGVPYSYMRDFDPLGAPDTSDELTQIFEARAPVEYFGRYWSDQLTDGYRAIAKLDRSQYMELSFEDLVDDPRGSLESLAEFFELPGNRTEARQRAADLVRGHPPTRFAALTAEQQEALDRACTPGMRLIGRG